MPRFPVLAVVLLAGGSCAPPVGSETIIWDLNVSFCPGCKAYAIKLQPDGEGTFEGNGYTAVREGRFNATPAQVRAFAERLAPYRPSFGGLRLLTRDGRECEQLSSDGSTVDVRWKGEGGTHARLVVYSGCDRDKNAAMIRAINAAPDVLPLKPLLGPEGYIRLEPQLPACAVHPETC